jgi:hypothetical protein
MSISMIYELVEWAVAEMVGGAVARSDFSELDARVGAGARPAPDLWRSVKGPVQ